MEWGNDWRLGEDPLGTTLSSKCSIAASEPDGLYDLSDALGRPRLRSSRPAAESAQAWSSPAGRKIGNPGGSPG
jgi:hypothetical protein